MSRDRLPTAWLHFQPPISVCDIHTRKLYSGGRVKAATRGIAQCTEFSLLFPNLTFELQ